MFDPFSETPITLERARKLVPGRHGSGVNIATIHRWQRLGVHGVRLETVLIGGIRHTSREAIARFIVATTDKASPAATSLDQEETAPPVENSQASELQAEVKAK